MSTVQESPQVPQATIATVPAHADEIVLYDHSALLYWWPVWAVGYVMALVTVLGGHDVQFQGIVVKMHASKNLGVIFTMTFFLVIIMTNFTLRGVTSVAVIIAIIALTFMFAYYGWWDAILRHLEQLAIYMNLGFYVFFSTAVLIAWVAGVFFYERLESWTFRPGQLEHKRFGGGAQVYDTTGISIEKLRDDFFRHRVLGLGSGDVHIKTGGANRYDVVVRNVIGINRTIDRIQDLAAMKPDEKEDLPTVTFGAPG